MGNWRYRWVPGVISPSGVMGPYLSLVSRGPLFGAAGGGFQGGEPTRKELEHIRKQPLPTDYFVLSYC